MPTKMEVVGKLKLIGEEVGKKYENLPIAGGWQRKYVIYKYKS